MPVVAGMVFVAASGCGKPAAYPVDLTFPVREDRLVLRVPTSLPPGLGEPGKLDSELAALDTAGGRTLDPTTVPAEQRETLDRFLTDTFGSPAGPILGQDSAPLAAQLGLTPERLGEGGKLYRRHCLQCHGLAGDGRGPTGQWIYPHPRDFRRGAFKFASTGDGAKPRKADLVRTIREGLKGTAMPAFGLLPDDQHDLMAEYVVYLSVRGQVEFQTLAALAPEAESPVDGDLAEYAHERLLAVLGQWQQAATAPEGPRPPQGVPAGEHAPADPESVRRGFELFTRAGVTDCATCHEDYGRKATYRYDAWGTVVRPADLTVSGFKGGGRPEELYQRIRAGIHPSGMPAHPTLTDAQVWDLVHFVQALPYPRELPPDVRAKVHP